MADGEEPYMRQYIPPDPNLLTFVRQKPFLLERRRFIVERLNAFLASFQDLSETGLSNIV
jgi:hypothetical protein